jgi:hypothetical protein
MLLLLRLKFVEVFFQAVDWRQRAIRFDGRRGLSPPISVHRLASTWSAETSRDKPRRSSTNRRQNPLDILRQMP